MKTLKSLTILITLLFFTSGSFAADETIEMLNKLEKESMVYSKKIVRIDVGDTVFWKSTNPGHNVEFIKGGVASGVEKFKTISKSARRYVLHSIRLTIKIIGCNGGFSS